MSSGVLLIPNVIVEVRDSKTKKLLRYSCGRNKVVDNGLNELRDLLGGTGFEPDEMAVGSGTVAPVAGDTGLGTETFRKAIDRRIGETKKITFQILLTSADANGTTIAEAGLFAQSLMYARALVSPTIAKTSSIDVTISHEISLASS